MVARRSVLILQLSAVAVFNLTAAELDQKSLEALTIEARAGDVASECKLAAAYMEGNGVRQDYTEEVKWLRKAADQNNAWAQYNLGICYGKGDGVVRDYVEAVKWWRKAAQQNDAYAEYALGNSYNRGNGVPLDQAEAAKWWRRAAEQNHAGAQQNLSTAYNNGEGAAKDFVEAYKWRLLSAGQGNEAAKNILAKLERKMTQEQIAEGQKLARNFMPRPLPSSAADSPRTDIVQSGPKASGSGFFITGNGYVVTNAHVVRDAKQVRLVTAVGAVSARVVKVDAANDLALLKADGTFVMLPVASSRTVNLGSTVSTVGFPNILLQGFSPKFSRGEIGSLSGPQDDARYFQISVSVQPGNSGGALVDERGNVVGVVSAKLSAKAALSTSGELPENVNYAVKSSFLLGFLESMPEVAAQLKEPNKTDAKSTDVVEQAKEAAALVLVY